MSDVTDLIERLRAMASETDRIHHDRWCKRKDVPVHGYSAEGNLFREAADALERLAASDTEAMRLVEQWEAEWRATPGPHWGDKIAWPTAREIARRIAALANIKQADAVEAERERNYATFTDGMEAAAEICGSLAETTYDDSDAFEAATGCEAEIMKVVRQQRAEQAAAIRGAK